MLLIQPAAQGLDSLTALKFVQALHVGTDIARMTATAAVYQAPENIYSPLWRGLCCL